LHRSPLKLSDSLLFCPIAVAHECVAPTFRLDGVENYNASDSETEMSRYFKPALTRLGALIAHPTAFIIFVCYIGAWLISDPRSFNWHAVATVATLLMTLFIQRAEHRDTQAIHAKLDELLRAEGRARSELAQLDDEEPEVIEQHRSEERRKN
jgi:low affinity Fe/Cu permease